MRSPKTIEISGTRRHVPEFGDVLGTEKDRALLPDQLRNCVGCLSAKRVTRLSTAEQDICVNEDTHQWSRPSYMASRLTA